MLSYPAAIPLSTRTLNHLADLIRQHRGQRRSRWRRLDLGRQALLALAHLRNGDTYIRLAFGSRSAWLPPGATSARARIRALAYAILAGTLKTWKVLAQLRCCPRRATAIVQAILVLHHVENPTYRG